MSKAESPKSPAFDLRERRETSLYVQKALQITALYFSRRIVA